jgi:hypothetical protein
MNRLLRFLAVLPAVETELNQINELLSIMLKLQQDTLPHLRNEREQLLDSAKVKDLLGISDSILFRYKKNKLLLPRALGGKYYYLSDIYALQEELKKRGK